MTAIHPGIMVRTVLVTGGAKRIGREICIRMAQEGFNVVVHHRNSDAEAQELVKQIHSIGTKAIAAKIDLSKYGSAFELIEDCNGKIGIITDLVNNASVFKYDQISTLEEQTWDEHMAVNARSQTMLIRKLAEILPDDQQGSVVNILDQKIASPNPDYLSYTASRFAMLGVTESLARGLAPHIRVNAISPGHTLPSLEQTKLGFEKAQSQSPLGFGPEPNDIADAVTFLMHAKSITGQVLFVDSGERFLSRERDVVFETEG